MAIVSLSLPEQMVQAMDQIQRSMGFSGRSELVRAAVRLMLDDEREKARLSGTVSGLLVVTHDQDREGPVTALKHKYEEVIRTHVHTKTSSTNCVELFIVQGPAREIVEMGNSFKAEDKMKSSKFIPF